MKITLSELLGLCRRGKLKIIDGEMLVMMNPFQLFVYVNTYLYIFRQYPIFHKISIFSLMGSDDEN